MAFEGQCEKLTITYGLQDGATKPVTSCFIVDIFTAQVEMQEIWHTSAFDYRPIMSAAV